MRGTRLRDVSRVATLPTYTNADNAAACCTYSDPAAASIVANVGLDLEETVQLAGAAAPTAVPAEPTRSIRAHPPASRRAENLVSHPTATHVRADRFDERAPVRSPTTKMAGTATGYGGYGQPFGSNGGCNPTAMRADWLERRLCVGATAIQMARKEAAPGLPPGPLGSKDGAPPSLVRASRLVGRRGRQ